MHLGRNGYTIVTELSIFSQCLPDTVIAALPGRALRDVVGYYSYPIFFASRYTSIVKAEMSDWPGGDSLELILAVKWHRPPLVLPHLR